MLPTIQPCFGSATKGLIFENNWTKLSFKNVYQLNKNLYYKLIFILIL